MVFVQLQLVMSFADWQVVFAVLLQNHVFQICFYYRVKLVWALKEDWKPQFIQYEQPSMTMVTGKTYVASKWTC